MSDAQQAHRADGDQRRAARFLADNGHLADDITRAAARDLVCRCVGAAGAHDVKGAPDKLKHGIALYVGGMGHKNKNFHKEMMIRRGFGDAAEHIQELYLAKRKDEAIAAVPDEFVDQGALIGPEERIRKRFRAWEDCGAPGLTIAGDERAVRFMAECARLNFAAE